MATSVTRGAARILVPVVVLILAAACSREDELRCSTGTAYREAESTGQLSVPDDLSVPDETEALRVPDPVPPPESGTEGCLEFSPALSQAPASEEED